MAATAAAVIDADLVGADLLPVGLDRWVVIELNGAVDFDASYSFPGDDVYAAAADALGLRESAFPLLVDSRGKSGECPDALTALADNAFSDGPSISILQSEVVTMTVLKEMQFPVSVRWRGGKLVSADARGEALEVATAPEFQGGPAIGAQRIYSSWQRHRATR